ncbi:HD domain-containing phosphohydrolase [Ferrimonas sp.]|uniref:HD domain-containing phosphohydrolase n=1 Tax=Ferrimonas sp. TaxID=2080861 RepID=UPI003A9421BC
MSRFGIKGISIRVTVVFVFIIGTLITAATAITLHYLFSSNIATEAVTAQAEILAKNTQDKVEGLHTKAAHSVEILARNSALVDGSQVDEYATDRLFANLLQNNNEFYAVYLGLANGDFYELINLEASPKIREQLGASLTDRFAKVRIHQEQGKRVKHTLFLNEAFEVSHQLVEPSGYDATTRPWFQIADTINASRTKPYLFQHLQAPGQTFSMVMEESGAVIAVDIALSTMSQFLSRQMATGTPIEHSEVFLYDLSGKLVASSDAATEMPRRELPTLPLSEQERNYLNSLGTVRIANETDWAPLDYSIAGQPRGYTVELMQMLARSLGLSVEFINGVSWETLVQHFQRGDLEILTPVYRTGSNSHWGQFSSPMVEMPMALATRVEGQRYTSLETLNGAVLAIPAGWSIISEIRRAYPQIRILETASVADALMAVIGGEADATIETRIILDYTKRVYFLEGLHIEPNLEIGPVNFDAGLRAVFKPELAPLAELFERALAQVGPGDRQYLSQRWLGDMTEIRQQDSLTVPYKALITTAQERLLQGKLNRLPLEGRDSFLYIEPLRVGEDHFFALALDVGTVLEASRREVLVSATATAICILALLPFCYLLANPIVNPIRQLAKENEKVMRRQYQQVQRQPSIIKEVDELSTSLVEMSAAIAEHEAQQQRLMDSFIEVIAQTIDDKSPYTGGHCYRVPELGLMLAREASISQKEVFSAFSIKDKDKHREFKLAAWLHDCGKISTPEHVVDKGSKLESSYNRIHEIRTRFEVLWRDEEIRYLEAVMATPQDEPELRARRDQAQRLLTEQFEFVARCNVGGEFMEDESIERLRGIATRTWQRHFDDCLGLGPLEERRRGESQVQLPVTENLLSDKPEHRIAWERKQSYDPSLGIKLEPTELQNNQGELYNLCIRKGTLNDEERFRINEHTVSTIKILESLPFPPELANVPRYASTHHETLKGTGYPRRLTGDQLSVGERILVLADIFEALTADDRPYKKAKSLSSAINILHKMVKDDHVDGEVFRLFLSTGVYMEYAERFLKPAQMDEVDLSRYLNEERAEDKEPA